jgi:hypothetical protein
VVARASAPKGSDACPAKDDGYALKHARKSAGRLLRLPHTPADGGLFPEVRADSINNVKHLFLLTLLYALEQRAADVPLEGLWEPRYLDHYQPNVIIQMADVPFLVNNLSMRRQTFSI